MRFNPKANIGSGKARDMGGGGGGSMGGGMGGGGGRLPIPGGALGGGGIGTLIIVILVVVLNQCMGGGMLGGSTGSNAGSNSVDSGQGSGNGSGKDCSTGEQANNDFTCENQALSVSFADFWSRTLADQSQTAFRDVSQISNFTGGVNTACGQASSAMGPFYCPADQGIYLDKAFYRDVLQGQLGGKGGDFVNAYVMAHEYGHHISNITGQMGQMKTQKGPDSDAVRLELQADCYAGMWAGQAQNTKDSEGNPIFEEITKQDISEAMQAAHDVGDDYIQQKSSGRVNEGAWTHGSSQQRQKWFSTGFEKNSMQACDTFAASDLG